MDNAAFAKALSAALLDPQVRSSIGGIVAESIKQELVALRAEVKQKNAIIDQLKRRVDDLESTNDDLEQYQRRNSLRISGLLEEDNEDTFQRSLCVINETMKVEPPIQEQDIDRLHRVGKQDGGKPRSIIVKFATYRARHRVMQCRRNLKNSNIFINEDLTRERSKLLYQSRLTKRQEKIKDCWTHDGSIVFKDLKGKIHSGRTLRDCQNLLTSLVTS
jgi:hypothetical protein